MPDANKMSLADCDTDQDQEIFQESFSHCKTEIQALGLFS